MDNQEIKKRSRGILFLWFLIASLLAAGTYVMYSHIYKRIITESSNDSVQDALATSTPLQSFSGDGYSFTVPGSWYVDEPAKDAVALYPDYSPVATATSSMNQNATCKIEMSVFPYSSNTDSADWISHRIGADPSVVVAEVSSADIPIVGGTGVLWNGIIDGAPTNLVYAFSQDHAYEIAPSVVNETSTGNGQCEPALDIFISQLTIQ